MSQTTSRTFKTKKPGEKSRHSREDQSAWLGIVDRALRCGGKVVVTIFKVTSDTVADLNQILKEHHVALRITADSDPNATEYFFATLSGATFGAATGGAAAAAFWATLKTYKAVGVVDFVVPGLGSFLIIPAAIGAVFGAVMSLSVTYYGVRIRFVTLNEATAGKPVAGREASKALVLEFAPVAA
jgi:hypothetical protein